MAGQIARALAVFCVDEVVIFDDGQGKQQMNNFPNRAQERYNDSDKDGYTGYSDPNYFLMHILSYLETPPHLRKHLFPLHPDLRTAGTLPSLDMPHHLRAHEWCQYREGVTTEAPLTRADNPGEGKVKKKRKSSSTTTTTTSVEAGLQYPVSIPTSIPPNTRVTLKFPTTDAPQNYQNSGLVADAVAPSAPREEAGYYWGYIMRSASSLSNVLVECSFDGGYDLTFGTSERGDPLSSLTPSNPDEDGSAPIPEFKHMLIVFGGVAGLEVAVKADEVLLGIGASGPDVLFDHWLNLCPGQGSRTIRTEEAVWLGLMGLRDVVLSKGMKS